MSCVGLDEASLGDGGLVLGFEIRDGGAGEGVVEADGAVGRAGEDIPSR